MPGLERALGTFPAGPTSLWLRWRTATTLNIWALWIPGHRRCGSTSHSNTDNGRQPLKSFLNRLYVVVICIATSQFCEFTNVLHGIFGDEVVHINCTCSYHYCNRQVNVNYDRSWVMHTWHVSQGNEISGYHDSTPPEKCGTASSTDCKCTNDQPV